MSISTLSSTRAGGALLPLILVVVISGISTAQTASPADRTPERQEQADDAPSLQETFSWLKSKLEGHSVSIVSIDRTTSSTGDFTNRFQNTFAYKDFKLDQCRLTYVVTMQFKMDEKDSEPEQQARRSACRSEVRRSRLLLTLYGGCRLRPTAVSRRRSKSRW
jgi:hypothetical protein